MPKREVNLDRPDVVAIVWKVHLANRKAAFFRFDGQAGAADLFARRPRDDVRNRLVDDADRESRLTITPAPQQVQGRNTSPQEFRNAKPTIPIATLGEIRTDAADRLLVLGGYGTRISIRACRCKTERQTLLSASQVTFPRTQTTTVGLTMFRMAPSPHR
ncbi:MAG: LodA/GoxA family CTQ-dependent oxidase [Verrucomicrobiales bacterium]|nr:LodA/GoxA family CTQ-dependent oxidase [Verrucomicrobiales bacterium]